MPYGGHAPPPPPQGPYYGNYAPDGGCQNDGGLAAQLQQVHLALNVPPTEEAQAKLIPRPLSQPDGVPPPPPPAAAAAVQRDAGAHSPQALHKEPAK